MMALWLSPLTFLLDPGFLPPVAAPFGGTVATFCRQMHRLFEDGVSEPTSLVQR
jgi:hypothetical protein